MNRVTHRYNVSLQLLQKLEKYVEDNHPTLPELLAEFRRLKLFYQCGLSRLDN